jgi:PAS domain S-box-containing protein
MKLTYKLPALVMLAVLLTAAIGGYAAAVSGSDMLRTELLDDNAHSVQTYGRAVDLYLTGAESLLAITASLPELSDFSSASLVDPTLGGLPAGIDQPERAVASAVLARSDAFEYVMLLRADGSVYMMEPYDAQTRQSRSDLSGTGWYSRLVSSGGTVVGDLEISTVTQQPTVIVATPVRDSAGELLGIWAGALRLTALSEIGHSGIENGPTSRYGHVTDSRGLIIAHQTERKYVRAQTDFSSVPSVKPALAGQSGVLQYVNPIDHEEKLAAYMYLPGPRWAVGYAVPTAVALAPIDELSWRIALIVAGVGVLMLLLSLAVMRQITAPISRLTQAAMAVGAGDLSTHIELRTGDELEQPGGAFNQMALELMRQQEAIQAQNEELQAQNEELQSQSLALQSQSEVLHSQNDELEVQEAGLQTLLGELRQSEERYHQLFTSMSEGFTLFELICDEGGNPRDLVYLDINPAGERLTGLRREETVGKTMREMSPDADGHCVDTLARVALSGEQNRLQCYNHNVDKWWDVLVFSPTKGQVATICVDITGQKRAEEAIGRLNEDLTRHAAELEQANREITDLNSTLVARARDLDAANAANKELESFAYSVSHDLRAPLRAIDGFSRILVNEYASNLPSDVRRYVGLMRNNAEQMGQLIDDILSFSRLSRQSLNSQQLSPKELVRQVLADLEVELQGRQVDVTVGDLDLCQGDPSLLRHVYVNLLSNALKYTRRKEPAVIEVGCHREGEETVYFVRDNGVGFDMRYAGKLFGVFQRLHRAEDYEGTGVGLAIVQRIVHRHGGRVWAEGAVGKGATFYFTLGGTSVN